MLFEDFLVCKQFQPLSPSFYKFYKTSSLSHLTLPCLLQTNFDENWQQQQSTHILSIYNLSSTFNLQICIGIGKNKLHIVFGRFRKEPIGRKNILKTRRFFSFFLFSLNGQNTQRYIIHLVNLTIVNAMQ